VVDKMTKDILLVSYTDHHPSIGGEPSAEVDDERMHATNPSATALLWSPLSLHKKGREDE
jgi:hypothetical protein